MTETSDGAESEPVAASPSVSRARTAAPTRRLAPAVSFVPLDALPEDQRALVTEAESLLRTLLDAQEQASEEGPAAGAGLREQVREVRTTFGKLRRSLAAEGDSPRARVRRKTALVNRVLTTLAKSVFAEDGATSGFLWPAGADGSRALAEVVRVLGAAAPAGLRPAGTEPPAEPQ